MYAALEQLGLRENTVVVFSSDNGGVVNGPSSNYPLRGGKTGKVRRLTNLVYISR